MMAVMNPNGKKKIDEKKTHKEFLNWQWSDFSKQLNGHPRNGF